MCNYLFFFDLSRKERDYIATKDGQKPQPNYWHDTLLYTDTCHKYSSYLLCLKCVNTVNKLWNCVLETRVHVKCKL